MTTANNTQQPPLNLTVNTPAIATDGNAISVNNDTGDTSLIFFQIAPQQDPKPEQMHANAVANVRLTLIQLKQLAESINKAVAGFEAKKKANS